MSQSAKHADINDIGELVTRARQFREEGHWIFRGAPKAFDLQPTIGRDIREELNGSGASYSLKQEQQLFDHFLRRSKPYLTHKPESVLEFLALAQHHGLYTRLRDWTESLLVAAYFAVERGRPMQTFNLNTGKTFDEVPVIYAVKNIPVAPEVSATQLQELNNRMTDDTMLYYPPHISPRIPAQDSVLTVHKNPGATFAPATLMTFSIRGKLEIWKHDLNACGVSRASLFPDIDGLAIHLSWLYKWGRLPG